MTVHHTATRLPQSPLGYALPSAVRGEGHPLHVRWARVGAGLLALLAIGGSSVWAQRPVRVSAGPCTGCTIDRSLVLTLPGLEEPMVGRYALLARASGGRWLLATMDKSPGVVAVYDDKGMLLTRFSRKGEGPGEHMAVHAMVVGRGDTVHLFDNALRRHSIFSPSFKFIGSASMPGSVLHALETSNGSLVVNASFPSPTMVGFPLHQMGSGGGIAKSFGVDVPRFRSDDQFLLTRAVAAANDGMVWAVPRLRYEPSLWSLDGKVMELQRQAAWFPPVFSPESPGGPRRPTPWVGGVWHDGRDHLWVLLNVPDPNWRPMTPPPGERRPPIDMDRQYDTIIEVIHTRTGELLGSQRFGELLGQLLPGGFVVHYRENAEGEPYLDVWQLRLTIPAGR